MIKHLLTFSHAFVRIVYVILVINHWMERPVRMSFMGKIVMSLFYVVGAFGWNNLPFKHSIYYWAKNFTLRFSYKHKLIEKKPQIHSVHSPIRYPVYMCEGSASICWPLSSKTSNLSLNTSKSRFSRNRKCFWWAVNDTCIWLSLVSDRLLRRWALWTALVS